MRGRLDFEAEMGGRRELGVGSWELGVGGKKGIGSWECKVPSSEWEEEEGN
uniref:Uncharacterized protein n=1 Tax=Desertifilum tharense IPPAS B-1220 TaxID=1781255 RepID=A0ACD5GPN4_9CYAN